MSIIILVQLGDFISLLHDFVTRGNCSSQQEARGLECNMKFLDPGRECLLI
jgi:hypothetical protein